VRTKTITVVASIVALVVLVSMVSVAAGIFASGQDFWILTIVGNMFAVLTAIAAWNGAFSKSSGSDVKVPPTCQEWIGIFFCAALLSGVFVAIDVASGHPGFSVVFTIGAVALSFIALPSALRAWMLERLAAGQDGQNMS